MDPASVLGMRLLYNTILRPPVLRLKLPRVVEPKPMQVCALLIVAYFLVSSGIVYDLVVEPPGMGTSMDPTTGGETTVPFLRHRINGQYIVEGVCAGFLFTLGGFGIIMLDWANDKAMTSRKRLLYVLSGILCILTSYNVCILFLKIKVPGYMQ